MALRNKVGQSKPVLVVTGYYRPGQYSRSGQYRSIGGQFSILAVIWKMGMSFWFWLVDIIKM